MILPLTGQHMNPGSLARTKSSLGAVAVDMAIRNVDVYSPILKGSKLEPGSQHSVHCIPVLIVVVLFLLWVGSKDPDATAEKFVMRGATSTNITATSHKLQKPHSNVNSLPKTKGVLNHVSSSHSDHGTSSLKIRRKEGNHRQSYLRGNPRHEG